MAWTTLFAPAAAGQPPQTPQTPQTPQSPQLPTPPPGAAATPQSPTLQAVQGRAHPPAWPAPPLASQPAPGVGHRGPGATAAARVQSPQGSFQPVVLRGSQSPQGSAPGSPRGSPALGSFKPAASMPGSPRGSPAYVAQGSFRPAAPRSPRGAHPPALAGAPLAGPPAPLVVSSFQPS